MDIIVEISSFRGNIHVSGYYPHIVDISKFRGYYPYFMDTIGISHITSYLECNVCHLLYSFVLAVDIIFGHITGYLARYIQPISHYSFRLNDWCITYFPVCNLICFLLLPLPFVLFVFFVGVN